jgi:hypothetical protein
MRRSVALCSGLLFALVPISPAFAATAEGTRDSLVVLQGDAVVPSGESVKSVVAFDGAIRVEGNVRQNVIAFHGPVTIEGTVDQDVVVFDGLLTVGSGARVGGDVFADDRFIDPSATVVGSEGSVYRLGWGYEWMGVMVGIAVWFAIAVSVLALGFALLGLAPRAADATFAAAKGSLGASIGWGFIAFFGLPAIGVAAIATLIGIPFGAGILLALALILAIGQTAGAWLLGRAIVQGPRAISFLLGWAILTALSLIPGVGPLLWFSATVMGLGGISVAIWHARREPSAESVPQIPAAPMPGPA